MKQDEEDQKKILEAQLKWIKEQVRILDEMDIKLHEMKEIAKYTRANKLSAIEIDWRNRELNALTNEYNFLVKKYSPVLH